MEVSSLNWLDWSIIGVIALSTLVGVIRGFVREGLSLVIWALAFWVAFACSNSLSNHLSEHISNSSIRYAASFGALFIGTLIVGGLINYLISQAVRKTGLGGTDRFLGLFFGFARGILVIGVVMLLAGLTPVNKETFWQKSQITPHFSWIVTWIHSMLPKSIEQHLQMTIDNTRSLTPDVTVNPRDINAPTVPAGESVKLPQTLPANPPATNPPAPGASNDITPDIQQNANVDADATSQDVSNQANNDLQDPNDSAVAQSTGESSAANDPNPNDTVTDNSTAEMNTANNN